MNKDIFKKNLNAQNYDECITILRKEIIDILTQRIKNKDDFFSYSTTRDLYNKSKQILTEDETRTAYKLYNLDIMYEIDEYILDEMLQMYKELGS